MIIVPLPARSSRSAIKVDRNPLPAISMKMAISRLRTGRIVASMSGRRDGVARSGMNAAMPSATDLLELDPLDQYARCSARTASSSKSLSTMNWIRPRCGSGAASRSSRRPLHRAHAAHRGTRPGSRDVAADYADTIATGRAEMAEPPDGAFCKVRDHLLHRVPWRADEIMRDRVGVRRFADDPQPVACQRIEDRRSRTLDRPPCPARRIAAPASVRIPVTISTRGLVRHIVPGQISVPASRLIERVADAQRNARLTQSAPGARMNRFHSKVGKLVGNVIIGPPDLARACRFADQLRGSALDR
jgi:hypothetical protein